MIKLSKDKICSYLGDIVHLELSGDGIDRNSDIRWNCEGSVNFRSFDGVSDTVLVILAEIGAGCITAEYNGKTYKTLVEVREMEHCKSKDCENFYFADLHNHTSTEHNHDEFSKHENQDISDFVNYVKNEGKLDLAVISDHAGVTNDYDFLRGFELAENSDCPVIFAGAESEINFTEKDRFDIVHRHSGEIVTFASAGYGRVDTWEELEEELSASPIPVAIFAHPTVVGFSTNGIWNFDFSRHASPTMLKAIRGIETVNGPDKEENLTHEYCYSSALDAGFRVSPVASSDSHGPVWGYEVMPSKTVIIAKDKSKESLHDALLSNRFYSTESGNVKLRYSVNGHTAPADLPPLQEYKFHIEVDTFTEDISTLPVRMQIISDYGKTVAEAEITENLFDITVTSNTARYFYLRLIDADGRRTWSMPVWCGREFDKNETKKHIPIDKSSIKAFSDELPAEKLVNGNPSDTFFSEKVSPVITLDLGKDTEISAFAYYPHLIKRDSEKGENWRTSHESRHLLSGYKLYSSTDGENYTLIREVRCQLLSDENFIEFTPRLARFVKMEAISTVGTDSGRSDLADSVAYIGELSLFN